MKLSCTSHMYEQSARQFKCKLGEGFRTDQLPSEAQHDGNSAFFVMLRIQKSAVGGNLPLPQFD